LAAFTPLAVAAASFITGDRLPAEEPKEKVAMNELLHFIEASKVEQASRLFWERIGRGDSPWEIHLLLFPVMQRVLNPPFINPHFPKMHGIYRELVPYLKNDEIAALVHLEVTGSARRPKFKSIPLAELPDAPVSFAEIEAAIAADNREKAAALGAAFCRQKGTRPFSRRLLLLGSGYLNNTLGHSLSCTAFILLEMLAHTDGDPWPAIAAIADYYCKGRFHAAPQLKKTDAPAEGDALRNSLWKATSGKGIVNLHHTITFYALERVRSLLDENEYRQIFSACVAFMGEKEQNSIPFGKAPAIPPREYAAFAKVFASLDAKAVAGSLQELIPSPKGRQQLGHFLIRAVSEKIKGDYNPHYLTGLGSALWVVHHFWDEPALVLNGLYQYLDFFFDHIGR